MHGWAFRVRSIQGSYGGTDRGTFWYDFIVQIIVEDGRSIAQDGCKKQIENVNNV